MKICYLSNSSLPSRHANSVHVANMAAGLARAGSEVTLMAFRGDTSLLSGDGMSAVFDFYGLEPSFRIEWMPNPMARGRSLLSFFTVWSRIKRLAPDLVIGRHGKACVAACLRGFPTVYETHKPLAWHSAADRIWLSRMFRSTNFRGLVTISQPLRDILAEELDMPTSRILVAHDAAPLLAAVEPIELGSPGRLQVGYVGAFYPGRGIGLILDVAISRPEMDFHLIGGTSEDVAAWHGEVPRLPNVFFHGFQTPARAAAMRSGCDVLLAPYQRKTLIKDGWDTTRWMSPLKIFEYMSSAKPILCSDLPVLREIMTHQHNALLLATDDPSAWSAALHDLWANPTAARALGERAFADFLMNHTWEQRARRIIAFAEADQ